MGRWGDGEMGRWGEISITFFEGFHIRCVLAYGKLSFAHLSPSVEQKDRWGRLIECPYIETTRN
ncbi:MAG: hypothetical protein SW833_07270 [Cyanobacteriota bacterium]|nr:hypothetical protein [Cyanobacteriota bacterium]